MRFEFATASRILFGSETLGDAVPIIAGMGQRALLITGRSKDRFKTLIGMLNEEDMQVDLYSVPSEPTIEIVNGCVDHVRNSVYDLVIGIGGGSVIDAGKAIAAMLTNPGDLLDYLEVIGEGKPLTQRPLPYVAIPTTAGTGSEVTRNAVIQSVQHQVKVSLRSPMMLPDLVVADPVLTVSVPFAITASTGLDALTQLIEPFVSKKANPMTDALCREGIGRVAHSLKGAFLNGDDLDARENMLFASLLSGLALANAGLGAVHGFAGPLGGMFPIPHGVICGRLLPFVMEANVDAIQKKMSDTSILARFDEIAQIVTGKASARARDGVKWVQKLCSNLNVPKLSQFGLEENHFIPVIEKAKQASSMKGNPIELTDEALLDCLRKAL